MEKFILFLIFSTIFISISNTEISENISVNSKSQNIEEEFEEINKLLNKRAVGIFAQAVFNRPEPVWKATSTLQPDGQIEGGPTGIIDFQPVGPGNFIRITVNGTGFPVGKHAFHIHVFGDLSQGCKSTGPHMLNNFIGNIEAKDGGIISATFSSPFISIFGVNGILGRAVVVHEKPIDINPSISPYFASPSFSIQSEEKEVGLPLACGSIIFANNLV